MSNRPEITIYYADGRQPETREMNDEEYAQHEKDIANGGAAQLPDPE
jgi:hypothetical protein